MITHPVVDVPDGKIPYHVVYQDSSGFCLFMNIFRFNGPASMGVFSMGSHRVSLSSGLKPVKEFEQRLHINFKVILLRGFELDTVSVKGRDNFQL